MLAPAYVHAAILHPYSTKVEVPSDVKPTTSSSLATAFDAL
jgi:hypothetical protein